MREKVEREVVRLESRIQRYADVRAARLLTTREQYRLRTMVAQVRAKRAILGVFAQMTAFDKRAGEGPARDRRIDPTRPSPRKTNQRTSASGIGAESYRSLTPA